MIGIALLTLKEGSFNPSIGEIFCLIATILYVLAIIITECVSHEKPLTIGILQVGFMGLFSIIISSFTEKIKFPAQTPTLYAIIALVIICTCFGFVFQPLAQSAITPERAGLFCAVGPIGGALTGYIFLGESINFAGVMGMILIIAAVILPFFFKREHL